MDYVSVDEFIILCFEVVDSDFVRVVGKYGNGIVLLDGIDLLIVISFDDLGF